MEPETTAFAIPTYRLRDVAEIVLKREEVASALVDFAREYGITHFVVGRPGERSFWQRWRPSLHEQLLRELRNVDLVVV